MSGTNRVTDLAEGGNPESPVLQEMTYEEWNMCSEFDANACKQKLFCDACVGVGKKPPKARLCPLAMCSAIDENDIYIQQHVETRIKIHNPTSIDLGPSSMPRAQLVSVTPIAQQRHDRYLLQYSESHVNMNDIFFAVSAEEPNLAAFKFSLGLQKTLTVLACSQGSGCDPLLACLFSYDNEVNISSLLKVNIFQLNTCEKNLKNPCFRWLKQTHSIPMYISDRTHILPPMLLFQPVCKDVLVCFHLHSKKQVDPQPCISEFDMLTESHTKKMALIPLLKNVGITNPRFHDAVFSPDAYLLVLSFSNAEFGSIANSILEPAAFIIINSSTYQLFKKINLPCPDPHNIARSIESLENKWICFKSYTPVFSSCCQKMAVASYRDSKVIVCVMNIPSCLNLQYLCRRIIRKYVKKEDVKQLKLPQIIRKYVEF